MNFKSICFEGDANTLSRTETAQPAILTRSVAIYKAYLEEYGAEIKEATTIFGAGIAGARFLLYIVARQLNLGMPCA